MGNNQNTHQKTRTEEEKNHSYQQSNIDELYQTKFQNFYNTQSKENEEKEKIYNEFNKIYGYLKFTKIRNEQVNNRWISIYYAHLDCMLCMEQRFIILISPIDNITNGETNTIDNIRWISFQTRTFIDINLSFKLKKQTQPMLTTDDILNEEFDIMERKMKGDKIDKSIYIAKKLPLKLELLHRGKNPSINDYADRITLISSLETYNCILNMT
jgi:hypothetical protein